ncbi:aldehyde dehydrogenase family protein, partial [Aquiluna sp.]
MRLEVKKTYKLFIGGKFPRSESGRVYKVNDHKGEFLANVAKASRKDSRDAVVAARAAQSGWAGATAYNRGQILYRIAEMLEGRREQFVEEIRALTGKTDKQANLEVDQAIDSFVWHAGWTDKIESVAGNMNPVAGPFFNISTNQPTGVVAAFAPQDTALVGLVNTIAPAIVSGNTIAVWLGSLEVETHLIARVGAGDKAKLSAEFLAKGVSAHLQEDSELPTGTIAVLVEGENRTFYTERGANKNLEVSMLPVDLFGDFLYISGYTVLSIGPEATQKLISMAQQHGMLVVCDPGSSGFIR